MAYGEVTLVPGINVEKTPTLNKAGISQSQLIRFKDGLVQKYGGWQLFYPNAIISRSRDLHVWADLIGTNHLSIGGVGGLSVITSGNAVSITPQTLTTNPSPNLSTTLGSNVVNITDAGTNGLTTSDSVFFNTPVAVGGLVLSGLYPITETTSPTSYQIQAATNASSTDSPGSVPTFATTNGSSTVTVTITNHNLVTGDIVVFNIPTTGNGVTISGNYTVTVTSSSQFTILVNANATASSTFSMNGGNAQFVYYINLGPPATGSGFGIGAYGAGGYGLGTSGSAQVGTPITATDWTSDNWGQILIACPTGGGIYLYDPTGGFTTAGLVPNAPIFNGGAFVSISEQILLAWGSTQAEKVGVARDPLLVRWSDVGDFTDWTASDTNQAGSFRIPVGSKIVAGAAVSNQNLFWTDLDLWAANYQGQPFVFGFNKIGAGAGAISSHAVQQLRGNTYWMGPSNFYVYDTNGVHVLPCPVWDFVFQNLNTATQANVRALPNTPFNEAGWAFPSSSTPNGECDSYVKFNITEPCGPWDYGAMPRGAWTDQSVLGPPISATPGGFIFLQETGNDANLGANVAPMNSSFTTGYFYISEGEDYAFVDQVLPDFKWGTYAGPQTAQIQMTFNVTNYPGDTPVTYGPYTVTQATEFITVRFRGRQMSITIASSDLGSFWRIGKVRYRYSADGRR